MTNDAEGNELKIGDGVKLLPGVKYGAYYFAGNPDSLKHNEIYTIDNIDTEKGSLGFQGIASYYGPFMAKDFVKSKGSKKPKASKAPKATCNICGEMPKWFIDGDNQKTVYFCDECAGDFDFANWVEILDVIGLEIGEYDPDAEGSTFLSHDGLMADGSIPLGTITSSLNITRKLVDKKFHAFVENSLKAHSRGQWGPETPIDVQKANEVALGVEGEQWSGGPLTSIFAYQGKKISIVTDAGRKNTLVEFVDGEPPKVWTTANIIKEVKADADGALIILDSDEVVEINKNAVLLHDNLSHWKQSGIITDENMLASLLRKHMRKK